LTLLDCSNIWHCDSHGGIQRVIMINTYHYALFIN